jgi:hypothetical protein
VSSSASVSESFPAAVTLVEVEAGVLVSDIALRFYRDIWLGQKIVLKIKIYSGEKTR